MAAKQGFLQALGVVLYCTVVGYFMWNIESIFGKVETFFAPVAFLSLFSVSALSCGLIVFYKPYKLFFDGKKKAAIDTVVATAAFLALFVISFFTFIFLSK